MRKILLCLILLLMLLFGGLTVKKLLEYRKSERSFQQLAEAAVSETVSEMNGEKDQKNSAEDTEQSKIEYDEKAPIQADFEKLKSENPECIGWLYCEDTPIHYPVMKAKDNETYLNDNFYGVRDFAGCLFLDCYGSSSFLDERNIVFGHNMSNNSMFGSLDGYSWGGQDYYEKHKVFYLLTPGQNFRLDVLAGTYLSEESHIFSYDDIPGWLDEMKTDSTFSAWKQQSDTDRYVLLATCSGRGHELRYVVVCGMKEIG